MQPTKNKFLLKSEWTRLKSEWEKPTSRETNIKPHTNFANEISSDKFLDRTFYTIVSIVAILGIALIIISLTR